MRNRFSDYAIIILPRKDFCKRYTDEVTNHIMKFLVILHNFRLTALCNEPKFLYPKK